MKQNWTYKKLGELGKISSGKSISSDCITENFTEGLYPCYGGNGLRGYVNTFLYDGFYPIIGRVGALCGNVHLTKGKFYPTEHALVMVTNGCNIPEYIVYALKSMNLNQYAKGVAQPVLSASTLSKLPIPVPPLSTQSRIVSELDLLQSLIDKQKAQLKEYDTLAQSIFYDMFGDPVENEMGWKVKSLNDVCDVRDGTHDSPKYIDGGDYILITSKNIVDGKIDYSNINYITKEDYDAINKRSKVDDGDIIMAMIGTIGKPIIVKMQEYKFCIKNVALIKFYKESTVSNIYIKALLSSSTFSQHIISKNQGGTQKFVALGTIRKLSIPIPPLSLQQSFAQKVESIERQKELINQSIREAQTLFDSRMEYYFGE